jgi:hypothetical protein
MAQMMQSTYGVVNAFNLDGGGSTTLTLASPAPHIANNPSDNPPRADGSNLGLFAERSYVAINGLNSGSILTTPTNVALQATTMDVAGNITNVTYYENGVFLGAATSAPYNVVWTNPPPGSYTLTAVATDDSGLVVTSAVVNVTVAAPAIVAGTAYYARPNNVSLKIAVTNLLTNVTDLSGYPITLLGVGTDGANLLSTNGTTLTTNATYIFYTNSVTPNVNDSFEYSVTDGQGDTALGSVVITMNNNLIGQTNVNLVVGTASVTATFFGVQGYRYAMDRSTNLTVGAGWVPISTNTAPANGVIQIIDSFGDLGIPIPPLPPTVFYRLRYNP